MKSRKDPEELFDGLSTLQDAPPEEAEASMPAAAVSANAAQGRSDTAVAAEAEEQPTEQWASTASQLFASQSRSQRQQKQDEWEGFDGTDLDETDFEAHLSALSAPLPRQGDTLLDVPLDKVLAPEELKAARVALKIEPEEISTDLDSTLSDALTSEEEPDTVEMTPEEAAAAIRGAQAALGAAMRKQLGVEPGDGQATHTPELSDPGQRTVMVKGTAESSSLTHQCRLCGRSISRPQPVRFRGLADSARGFRCERCQNVVCAAHAHRISGFWESLCKQGRFCCSLCLPGGTLGGKSSSSSGRPGRDE